MARQSELSIEDRGERGVCSVDSARALFIVLMLRSAAAPVAPMTAITAEKPSKSFFEILMLFTFSVAHPLMRRIS